MERRSLVPLEFALMNREVRALLSPDSRTAASRLDRSDGIRIIWRTVFVAVQVQTRIDGQRAALAFIRVESAKEDLRSTIQFMLLDNLSPPRADAGCKSG